MFGSSDEAAETEPTKKDAGGRITVGNPRGCYEPTQFRARYSPD
jgi:hypothetical protein